MEMFEKIPFNSRQKLCEKSNELGHAVRRSEGMKLELSVSDSFIHCRGVASVWMKNKTEDGLRGLGTIHGRIYCAWSPAKVDALRSTGDAPEPISPASGLHDQGPVDLIEYCSQDRSRLVAS